MVRETVMDIQKRKHSLKIFLKSVIVILLSLLPSQSCLSLAPGLVGPKLYTGIGKEKASKLVKKCVRINLERKG